MGAKPTSLELASKGKRLLLGSVFFSALAAWIWHQGDTKGTLPIVVTAAIFTLLLAINVCFAARADRN